MGVTAVLCCNCRFPLVEADMEATPAGPQGDEAERVAVLVCSNCRFPLVEAAQIVRDRFQSTFDQAVYSYELDVLDSEVWCYSATNPQDYRFDVVRVGPALYGTSPFKYHGKPTPEHSWFAGYSW